MATRSKSLVAVGSIVALAAVSSPAWAQRIAEPAYFASTTGSGARALGMGGAFIAIADDATASSWNPAGLCVLERAEASLVFQPLAKVTTKYTSNEFGLLTRSNLTGGFVSTNAELENSDPYDLSRDSRSFDFASVTVPLRLGGLKVVPQLSYQRQVDMGLDYSYRTAYQDTIARETRNPAGAVSSTVLDTGGGSYRGDGELGGGLDVIGLSSGIGFSSKLYLGLALNLWRNGSNAHTTYGFDRNATNQGISGTLPTSGSSTQNYSEDRTVTEDFTGTNFQVGILAKPKSWLSVGATYKSGFDMDYEYQFDGTTVNVFRTVSGSGSTAVTSEDTNRTQSSSSRTGTIRWPASVGGGIAVMPKETLTFSVDATLIQWSKGHLVASGVSQSQLTRTNVRTVGSGSPSTTNTTNPPSSGTFDQNFSWPVYMPGIQEKQPDALQVRLGAEYVLRNPGFLNVQVLPLRVGLVRDRQLVKDYQSDTDVYYTGVTTGLGLTWSRLSLDLAYLFTRGSRSEDYATFTETATSRTDREQDLSGKTGYRSSRFFVSTTVRF